MFLSCRLVLPIRLCRSFSFKMSEKFYNVDELKEMTREQLVSKVMHFQNVYRQSVKKMTASGGNAKLNYSRKRKNAKRTVDFKECKYRRIALKFAYLGWDYGGLQAQLNVDNTVEEFLRTAIRQSRLASLDDPLKLSRSGRTDKGVSAFQQVVTVRLRTRFTSGPGVTSWVDPSILTVDDRQAEFMVHSDDETTKRINEQQTMNEAPPAVAKDDIISSEDGAAEQSEEVEFDYVQMLNRVLPAEIRVLAWSPVPDEAFSARHDCLGREYRYYFTKGNLDIGLMNEAAQLFCGEHDFRNFGKMNVVNTVKFVRKIREFSIESTTSSEQLQPYDMCFARIDGSGFIYHQVRNMMSILYLIGAGLETPDVIRELLDVKTNGRKPSYGLTDAYPLVLYRTKFANLHWRVSDEARTLLRKHFHRYWNESATKTAIVYELIKSMKDECGSELGDAVHDLHTRFTLAGFRHNVKKPYRKIMDLPRGPTLEEKLESLDAKRRRLGLPESDEKVVCQ